MAAMETVIAVSGLRKSYDAGFAPPPLAAGLL
jgi:hypothetical protein